MLDHRTLTQDPDPTVRGLERRGVDAAVIKNLMALTERRRTAIHRAEDLRRQLNEASAAVSRQAKAGDMAGVERARGELKGLKGNLKDAEEEEQAAECALQELLLMVPNLPQASVPDGPDESHNRIERTVGEPPTFGFTPLAHWDLVEQLGLVDFERAAKMSGARFAVYRGAGARLERAVINFMLDMAREHGFEEIAPPLLVRPESMQAAAQYPKFVGESFETLDRELALIPTSEVPLVNLHRDEILDGSKLPLRYTAYTPCFRREAGAAGKDTRGLIRQHQFNKVELVAYCTPESSNAELDRLTGCAESVLQKLKLPYRVVSLCTGDLGFASTKTYDLEVWLPGQNTYREISSCSNCGDFQARRARIRYRPEDEASAGKQLQQGGGGKGGKGKKGAKAKPQLLHTLNGSGLAAGRTFVAVVENYQEEDGSIRIPDALIPYFGSPRIEAPKS